MTFPRLNLQGRPIIGFSDGTDKISDDYDDYQQLVGSLFEHHKVTNASPGSVLLPYKEGPSKASSK